MIPQIVENTIVLLGWVIPFVLGIILLVIKSPSHHGNKYYESGKNTCAMALLLFALEIFFQWMLRITSTSNLILSASFYLLTFTITTILFSASFCTMLAPDRLDKRQKAIAYSIPVAYLILLAVNYFMPSRRLQFIGLTICCGLLLMVMCVAIYKCISIYKAAITNLRKYYSDVVEDVMRWIPGVGVGILLFHISAPIICLCPRWVGVYQVALGIIMFIYTFICIINFSFRYTTVANVLDIEKGDDDIAPDEPDQEATPSTEPQHTASSMSQSLLEVMQDKEKRWHEKGGYRTPGITIDQAAREMGTNRSYLSRYLNESRNMTFYEWVADMRIQEAKALLLNDRNASIEQIATQVGFTSHSTFSSTFKKMLGTSPNAWRNQQ